MSVDAVIEQAMKLSVEERSELMVRLQEIIDEPEPADPAWEAAWTTELDRRLQDIREGRVELIDGKDVFAEARRIASRRR